MATEEGCEVAVDASLSERIRVCEDMGHDDDGDALTSAEYAELGAHDE
jgi:hypothetical protein